MGETENPNFHVFWIFGTCRICGFEYTELRQQIEEVQEICSETCLELGAWKFDLLNNLGI